MSTAVDIQKKMRGLTNQLRLLGVLCIVLILTVFVLAGMVRLKPGFILVPTLQSDIYMGGPKPSEAYLEAMTRDVIQLYLNRHPNNTRYFRDHVLRIVDPARQGEFQAALDESEKSVKSQAATTFFPQDIYVDASNNVSEVGGILETYIGTQKVQSAQKKYQLRWIRRGGGVFLEAIGEVTPEASLGAAAPFQSEPNTGRQ